MDINNLFINTIKSQVTEVRSSSELERIWNDKKQT